MNRLFIVAVVLIGAMLWPHASLIADDSTDHPACIQVTGRAQYVAYGYNHIVHLNNTCEQAATCRVSTDVNPVETSVHLNVHQESDVVTFRGSPATAFRPRAVCTFDSR